MRYCGIRNCGWLGSFQIDHVVDLVAVAAPDRGRPRPELLRARARDVVLAALRRPARDRPGQVEVHLDARALRRPRSAGRAAPRCRPGRSRSRRRRSPSGLRLAFGRGAKSLPVDELADLRHAEVTDLVERAVALLRSRAARGAPRRRRAGAARPARSRGARRAPRGRRASARMCRRGSIGCPNAAGAGSLRSPDVSTTSMARLVEGLIVDYGGVLTTDVFASFRAFCEAEGLAPETVRDRFRRATRRRAGCSSAWRPGSCARRSSSRRSRRCWRSPPRA